MKKVPLSCLDTFSSEYASPGTWVDSTPTSGFTNG